MRSVSGAGKWGGCSHGRCDSWSAEAYRDSSGGMSGAAKAPGYESQGGSIKGLNEGREGDAGCGPGNGPQGRRLGGRGGDGTLDDKPSLDGDEAAMFERVADDR